MQHRTITALPVVGAIAILIATACTTGGQTAASPTAAASELPQKGGRIIEGTISDIATMQPILVNDTASGRITDLIYENLLIQDPQNGETKPRVATFSQSTDGLTYTYEINAKANWSDGKPIIADDVLTALEGYGKSKKTVRKSNFQDVVGFKDYSDGKATTIPGFKADSSNPKKFSITLTKVSCPAINDLNIKPLPTQIFGKYVQDSSKDEIDSAPENTQPTVFSGQFKFVEWRKGDQVILSKNDTYWQGAPNVDQYIYKVLANQTAVANALKTGEITFYVGLQAKDLADMQTVDSVQIQKYPALGYTFIGWNTASPTAVGLGDKRVRQALAFGIDMDQVIKAVVFGEATKNLAHHVKVQWAYPTSNLNQYTYDKNKALQLLKDAGWTPGADGILQNAQGKKFNLTISTNSGNTERETLAQVAAEQYKALGINAKAAPEAFQGLVTKLTTGDSTLEATIIGWSLTGDVDPYSIWHSSNIPDPASGKTGFGFTYFKDPAMDKAIEEARNPSNSDCSTAARKKQYETFNQILNENQPYNFGYENNTIAVSQKTMHNFAPAPYSTIYNAFQWWVKQ